MPPLAAAVATVGSGGFGNPTYTTAVVLLNKNYDNNAKRLINNHHPFLKFQSIGLNVGLFQLSVQRTR